MLIESEVSAGPDPGRPPRIPVRDRVDGDAVELVAGDREGPSSGRLRKALIAVAGSKVAWGMTVGLLVVGVLRTAMAFAPQGPVHPISKQLLIWSIGAP